MNSESETVEERARRETNEIVTATAIAYGLNCYPGGDIEGPYGEHSLTWLAIESYKKGAALASTFPDMCTDYYLVTPLQISLHPYLLWRMEAQRAKDDVPLICAVKRSPELPVCVGTVYQPDWY